MTEEIIVDGVNVAGCEFFTTLPDKKYCGISEYSNTCEGDNCYYKQLVCQVKENEALKYIIDELKQENKALKDNNNHLQVIIDDGRAENKRFREENKELEEVNQSLSILGTDLASAHETVRKEFFRADKNKDMWREKAEEYRSALEEIRIIADDTFHCCDDDCGNARKIKLIIDKINEVLGNEV